MWIPHFLAYFQSYSFSVYPEKNNRGRLNAPTHPQRGDFYRQKEAALFALLLLCLMFDYTFNIAKMAPWLAPTEVAPPGLLDNG
jgi:hypothetical protein